MCVEVCSHQIVCNPDTTLCCWSAHALDNLHKTSNRTACNMSDPKPQPGDTLVEAALKVLLQADPWLKAEYTYAVHRMWNNGEIATIAPSNPVAAPDRPSRDDSKVKVLPPGAMPRRGKGGSLASRQAMLHSLVHIENWAIDLSWDIIARFGCDTTYQLPREFFTDFVQVAEDECRHFTLLCQRLEELGSHYGAFPAHDGLWESATTTAGSLPARLAVEHCCHEARGLDVLPSTIAKFRNNGDEATAALLETVVYPEEVSHCAAGVRWLKHLHRLAHTQQREQQQQTDGRHPEQQQQQPQGHTQPQPADSTSTTQPEAAAAGALSHLSLNNNVEQQQQQQLGTSTAADQLHSNGCSSSGSGSNGSGGDGADHKGTVSWQAGAAAAPTVQEWFHDLVRSHFYGGLKPPFNTEARAKAGFDESWYLPLVQ